MNKGKRLVFTHLIIIILLMFPSMLMAQKKEISEARANIKKGTNLENAEKSMRTLLKDSANQRNEKIWLTLFDAVKKQYEQLNEKLYLKQQSDTAKFFTHTLHMFDVLESLDSIDAMPNKKGVVVPTYRKTHAAYLNQYRTNLFGGGSYFVQKQNFAEAYKYFDAYLECAIQPLFADYFYSAKDKKMPEAAYWAVFCGYKLGKANLIDKYVNIAMQDSTRDAYILQYVAESYLLKNDTANYRKTLETGFAKYPDHIYYFPHLAICYAREGRDKEVVEISKKALELNPNNTAALLAESTAFLNLGRYDDCVVVSDKIISLDATVPVAYLNAGLSYYDEAQPLASLKIQKKADKNKIADLYKRSLSYLEKYRQMAPDDSDSWAQPLYDIYLTLNMGKEFEEMEKYVE